MTTVTEAAKRLTEQHTEEALKKGDPEKLGADPLLAQRFARRLVEAAREIAPGHKWTMQDLRDLLEIAVNGPPPAQARLLQGRYFRKRLREQCNLAERYGDTFGCVVVTLADGDHPDSVYNSVLDAVTERLRRTDMVFLYRRRFALILPRMGAPGIGPLIERVLELIGVGAGQGAVESVHSVVFPHPDLPETQSVLDWAEDRLRND